MDSEQQQDQSSIDTLSGTCINRDIIMYLMLTEKLKLLEKMSKAKTLEIEKLTGYKEGESCYC